MSLNHGYVTPDGWVKIFRHNTTGGYWSNANGWAEVLQSNIDNPNADKYSQLYKLNSDMTIDGEYVFKMVMPTYTNTWAQTHNILENAPAAATVPGYRAIDVQTTANAWGGLSLSDGASSFIDGNPLNTNWYYPLGSIAAWNGALPLWSASGLTPIELWIKIR